ncbi:hypothetical protein BC834DRAFT_910040 [Gloeopeniophorella convolvens]|nr:hypothetical protein BC834DRAFT_910040 [Gloeopeniophorella convolvens]
MTVKCPPIIRSLRPIARAGKRLSGTCDLGSHQHHTRLGALGPQLLEARHARAASTTHHYIRFALSPPCADALLVRRALQEALAQSFGAALSHTYLDVLWVADTGEACVVRTSPDDAASVMAAAAVASGRPRLAVLRESPFLPSIAAETRTLF